MSTANLVKQFLSVAQAELNNSRIECGIHTKFVRLNENIGVRIYHEEKYAQLSIAAQHAAHKIGCGPAVYSSVYTTTYMYTYEKCLDDGFDMETYQYINLRYEKVSEEKQVWFYLTEIVDVAQNIMPQRGTVEYTEMHTELVQVVGKLGNIGYQVTDLHSGNYGKTKQGKVVLLDFSNVIWEWQDKGGEKEFYKLPAMC